MPFVSLVDPASLFALAATSATIWAYVGFLLLVFVFLALDLGVFHREAHEVGMKEATIWSLVWITCGVLFGGFVHLAYDRHWLGLGIDTPIYASPASVAAGGDLVVRGTVEGFEAAKQYLVGYVVEKSLAMDNIFVIALVFGFLGIPGKYQHRVLFWGILGALVLRGTMILVGAELVVRHQWILIVFGFFLLLTALKMALIKGNDDPTQSLAVRIAKRLFPTVDFLDGDKFFTRRTLPPTKSKDPVTGREAYDPAPPGTLSARRAVTPLFLALVLVEVTDVVFAVDSIPAIFAITPDPFLVLTSNVFAMLGLRSLYFCLAALIQRFRFLKPALIGILAFVGVKLLLLSLPPHLDVIGLSEGTPVKVDTTVSLVVILGTLVCATILSVLFPRPAGGEPRSG